MSISYVNLHAGAYVLALSTMSTIMVLNKKLAHLGQISKFEKTRYRLDLLKFLSDLCYYFPLLESIGVIARVKRRRRLRRRLAVAAR